MKTKRLTDELLAAICANANVEVFYVDARTARGNRKREEMHNYLTEPSGAPIKAGWHYWTCLPGCLPDSDAFGPYRTARAAMLAAYNDFDLPRRYEYYINMDERGEFNSDVRDELGRTVWECESIEFANGLWECERVNVRDVRSLEQYLQHIGVIDGCATLEKGN